MNEKESELGEGFCINKDFYDVLGEGVRKLNGF